MIRRNAILALAGTVVAALPAVRLGRPVVPTAVVRAGSFSDLLVESGMLAAARVTTYGAPVGAGPARVVDLIAEGTQVEPGDTLIRFDTSALDAALARELSAGRAADAERLRAREELEVEQLRADSDAQSAKDRVTFADQALANAVDGQGRVELAETEDAAADAAREAERTRKAFDDLKPLLAEGFVTRAELDKSEQASKRAAAAASLAAMRARAMADFQRPAAIAKSRAELGTARDALGRTRDTAVARLQQAQAALALAESRVVEAQARIAGLRSQIAASIVTAQSPGLVIYRDIYFGADRRKPQVGDDVAPNQPLLTVPDASHLTVESRVREVDVRKVAVGQRLTVHLDAYPDLSVAASVSLIGALAIDDPSHTGARFFPLTITIDGRDPRLRPGMTARADIPTAPVTGAHLVPLAAVFDADGDRYCLVVQGSRTVRRPVTVVGVTDAEAAVRGVAAGEVVALTESLEPGASR